jgi:hypothetical protein
VKSVESQPMFRSNMSPASSVLKNKPSKDPASMHAELVIYFDAGFMLGLFFDPENGGACCSETSVSLQRSTWRYIPEDRTLHNHRCENVQY